MRPLRNIYLAGPLGFSEGGRRFHYDVVIPIFEKHGYSVIDPWNLTPQSRIDHVQAMPPGHARDCELRKLNIEIAENNTTAIRAADAIFAVLDGSDVDSGTAAEIGLAFALGLPIIGYRSDHRLCAENTAAIVNIQVEYFICRSRGEIIRSIEELPRAFAKLRCLEPL